MGCVSPLNNFRLRSGSWLPSVAGGQSPSPSRCWFTNSGTSGHSPRTDSLIRSCGTLLPPSQVPVSSAGSSRRGCGGRGGAGSTVAGSGRRGCGSDHQLPDRHGLLACRQPIRPEMAEQSILGLAAVLHQPRKPLHFPRRSQPHEPNVLPPRIRHVRDHVSSLPRVLGDDPSEQ